MKPLGRTDPTKVGAYRLSGVLGDGGMGRVYLGRSPTGRRVAIKVIRTDLAEDVLFRRRFAREVAAVRAVSPLFTAPMVDADTDAEPPWLATIYIEAPSLREWVAEHGPLAPGAVLVLAAGLAEALASIHRPGLVHRDLKPSNVLLDDAGPRIIDFGIAVLPDATSHLTTSLVGTPSYLAPELIDGGAASPASDVFALGATLYFAATGASLAGDGSVFQQMIHIATGRYDLSSVPRPVRAVVVRCVSRRPSDRPTPEELARVLVSSGVGAPGPGWYGGAAPAPPPVPVRLPGPRLARRRVLAVGGLAAAAVAGGGAAAALGAVGRHGPSEPGAPAPGSVLWLAPSGAAPAVPGDPEPRVSVVAEQDARLITAAGSRVTAVDRRGRQRWRRELPGDLVTQRRWGDAVLVTGLDRVWLLDAATGAQRFVAGLGGAARVSDVLTAPDRAFVDLGTATVTIDRRGRELWRRPHPTLPDGRVPAAAPSAANAAWLVVQSVVDTTALVTLADAGTGGPRWSIRYPLAPADTRPPPPPDAGGLPPDGAPPDGPPPDGAPPADPAWQRSEARIGSAWVALRNARELRVLRITDGGTVWRATSPTPVAGIEVAGDLLLVSADRINAYDLGTGRPVWQAMVRGARLAVSADGATIVAATERTVSAFDRTGRPRWQVGLPAGLVGAVPDRVSVQGRAAYVTFRPRPGGPGPLAADVLAVAVT